MDDNVTAVRDALGLDDGGADDAGRNAVTASFADAPRKAELLAEIATG